VAVKVVFFDGFQGERIWGKRGAMSEIGHTRLHFAAYIDDRVAAAIDEINQSAFQIG
jgi:hypothetical protein